MEETSNYHLNKPSLKDKSKIMPVIQNFSNIEIIINRIILEMNEFINNFNHSITQDKINELKTVLIEELKTLYLEKSTIDEIMNKIDGLMTDKATVINKEEMKDFILNFIQESYLSKANGNNSYGLKSDYTKSQQLEKDGRKKLAQALNNQGVQTPLESNYDVISQNIQTIQSFNRNSLYLVEFNKLTKYIENNTFEVTSDTGGVLFINLTKSYKDIASSRLITLEITVDDNEPVECIPCEAYYSTPALFYPIATEITTFNSRDSLCAGAIQFNNKIKVKLTAENEAGGQAYYSIYKWQRNEVRNTKINKLTTTANISNKISTFSFTFNGKGIFSPTFITRQGVTSRIKLFIDDKEPIVFFTYAKEDLTELGIEVTPKIRTWAYDSKMLEVFSNGYNMKKGYYIKNTIRIEVEEYTGMQNKNKELYYQFTPL